MAIHFEIRPPGNTGKTFSIYLDMDKILIGRGAPNDIILPSPAVSYRHATIELVGANYCLIDTGSKNGTYLRGKKISPGKRYPIAARETIGICGFDIKVSLAVAQVEPFSAEKTDVLARNMLAAGGAASKGYGVRLEVIEGDSAGKIFEVPPKARSFTIGTDEKCDLHIIEKKAKKVRLEITLEPGGWKIKESVCLPDPARKKLRDGDVLAIGNTRIIFHDEIDRILTEIKTRQDFDEKELLSLPPAAGKPSPPHATSEEKNEVDLGREENRNENVGRKSASSMTEIYAAQQRIAAALVGIIAFLISLLILILLLF